MGGTFRQRSGGNRHSTFYVPPCGGNTKAEANDGDTKFTNKVCGCQNNYTCANLRFHEK